MIRGFKPNAILTPQLTAASVFLENWVSCIALFKIGSSSFRDSVFKHSKWSSIGHIIGGSFTIQPLYSGFSSDRINLSPSTIQPLTKLGCLKPLVIDYLPLFQEGWENTKICMWHVPRLTSRSLCYETTRFE